MINNNLIDKHENVSVEFSKLLKVKNFFLKREIIYKRAKQIKPTKYHPYKNGVNVKMALCTPGRHMEREGYGFTHSQPWQEKMIGSKFQASAVSLPEKKPHLPSK